jgi:hypothetical protein
MPGKVQHDGRRVSTDLEAELGPGYLDVAERRLGSLAPGRSIRSILPADKPFDSWPEAFVNVPGLEPELRTIGTMSPARSRL